MARGCGRFLAICLLAAAAYVLILSYRHRHQGSAPHPAATAGQSLNARAETTATSPPHPTSTSTPLPPTPTSVVQVSTVQAVSRHVYTGERYSVPQGATAVIKDIDLKTGDILVGHGEGFMQTRGGCQVFLVRGPFNQEIAVMSGSWTIYIGQKIPNDSAEDLLQKEIASVRGVPGCADPSVTRPP